MSANNFLLMDFFSHILWVHIPTRNKIWHSEALFFAMLPDVGFLLIMFYSMFWSPGQITYSDAMRTIPQIFLDIYFMLHSFITVFIVGIILWKLKPRLLPALSGWVIHILLDIPFHETSTFATRFIFPLSSDVYFQGITWNNILILALNYLAIVCVYAYVIHKENMKQKLGDEWEMDMIDEINCFIAYMSTHLGAYVFNDKRISVSDGKRYSLRRAFGTISGKDQKGIGEIEDNRPRTVLHEDGGG